MRISDWSSDVCSSDLLFIAATATFAISRLRVRGGGLVSNLALATCLVPPAFLAIPMYKVMATYGLLNSQWSLILTMVTFASPYAIRVLKPDADKDRKSTRLNSSTQYASRLPSS